MWVCAVQCILAAENCVDLLCKYTAYSPVFGHMDGVGSMHAAIVKQLSVHTVWPMSSPPEILNILIILQKSAEIGLIRFNQFEILKVRLHLN